MPRLISRGVVPCAMLFIAGALLLTTDYASWAQEAEQRPAAAAERRARRRLPNYYAQVVDQEQREEIYGVQAKYQPQIDELQAKLQAVLDQRDTDIAAVLTPEQLRQVAELTEAARKRRAELRSRLAAEAEASEGS